MAREPTVFDDGLNDAERKFLTTGGESGLPEEPAPAAEPPAPAPAPAPETPPVPPVAEPPAAEAPPATAEAEEDEGEPPVDPKTGKRPPRQVNFNKYKRLQDDYEAQGKQLSEMRDMMTRADERIKIINDALAPPSQEQQEQQNEDPPPDPTQDIFGYLAWQNREMGRMQERYDAQIQDMREHVTTREQHDAIVSTYQQSAVEFARTQPAFAHAYNFLVGQRLAELEAMGYTDKKARDRMIVEEEFGQVYAALQARTNPAERIYNLAVARGFKPSATPPAAAPRAAAPAAPAAPPPPAQPSVASIIDSVVAGQSAAKSLSSGGGAPADTLTPEWLATLNDEDFGRVVDRLSKSRLRELLPGA